MHVHGDNTFDPRSIEPLVGKPIIQCHQRRQVSAGRVSEENKALRATPEFFDVVQSHFKAAAISFA